MPVTKLKEVVAQAKGIKLFYSDKNSILEIAQEHYKPISLILEHNKDVTLNEGVMHISAILSNTSPVFKSNKIAYQVSKLNLQLFWENEI
jgi:hypothetical protein